MTEQKTACVLIIGNEILSGKTQDQNLQFFGQAFARLGILLVEARVIRDDPDTIVTVLNRCRSAYDYVFTTGGIGPTHDDLTSESVARAFGVELVRDAQAVERIGRGGRELTEARLKMAMIPSGASLIDNPISHAPGFRLDNVFVMAGIPKVARAMFAAIEHELSGGAPILSASHDIFAAESDIAGPLDAIARRFAELEIGSYPFSRDGRFGASIVVRGTDQDRIDAAIAEISAIVPGS